MAVAFGWAFEAPSKKKSTKFVSQILLLRQYFRTPALSYLRGRKVFQFLCVEIKVCGIIFFQWSRIVPYDNEDPDRCPTT